MSRAPGFLHLALLGWVSMLGTDLLLHAGILAPLYVGPDPFLLPPMEAFRRIPLGYLSFLVLALLQVHLQRRLGEVGWGAGLRFGLLLGAAIWGALTLGLASISTAGWPLLAGWFAGQTVELGISGALVGAALAGVRVRRLWLIVAGWCVAAVVVTVVLQNLPGGSSGGESAVARASDVAVVEPVGVHHPPFALPARNSP